MNGVVTQLTYLCPTTSATSKLKKTVFVTVTITESVSPILTSIVVEVPGAKSSAELTTTVTLRKTDTITKTMTLQHAIPDSMQALPVSETPEVVVTKWSNIASSDIATPVFSIAPIRFVTSHPPLTIFS
jgi:hypothetical protein